MLTLKQKKDIYGLLLENFEKGVDIPLASLALYLKGKNIDYTEFGYKKMKSLLNDLEFLSLKTRKANGHENVYVVIHDFSSGGNPVDNKKKTLTEEEKKRIFSLLLLGHKTNVPYPLSNICQSLLDDKVNYKDYGYSKVKSFLSQFTGLIKLNEDKKSNLPTVTLIKAKEEKKKKGKKEEATKGNNLPNISSDRLLFPDSLCLSIKDFTDLGLDNNSLKNRVLQDYQTDKKQGKVTSKDDCLIFPLSFLSKDKENLIASIKKADGKKEYDYLINFLGADREKPKNALKNDIHFSDFDKSVKELALLAKNEKWCYRHSKDPYVILKIYLQYTYYRLQAQNKIFFDKTSGFASFNTGLKTEDYEDIYAVLLLSKDKSIQEKYLFQGFTVSASQGLGKIIVEHFNPLPKRATYIENSDEIFFDTNKEIHTDERHIILDNIDRFPLDYLSTMVSPFSDVKKILDTIKKTKSDLTKEKLYRKLEESIEKNSLLYTLLKTSLDNTISKAKRMVEYDYRMALASFFPTRNVISIMLPLEFTSSNGVEAVLLVEKTQSGNYQGQTILTSKQAYVNARLLSPLEHTYLDPNKIED